jgi:Trk K+ transport system NAD-binding subunit
LAAVWALFGLSQSLRSESGLMATVAAGIAIKASSIPEERLLKRFKGQLTVLCVSVLFVLLAADLSIASVIALGWGSVGAVLVLMLIVRPISIAVCTWNSNMNWRQKIFLAWIAPKGIVSASVASLFAILLTEKGINGGDAIKALVFLTILMTVFFQGLTARWVANWLKITSNNNEGAVIIGCNPLGRFMGRLYQQLGESVVMIDTDPEACRKAEADNLTVFQSSALDPEVLTEAGIESMGTFLALTNNGEVNIVLAQRAIEEFQPPKVLAAYSKNNSTENNSKKIAQALIPQLQIKTWNTYIDDAQIKLGRTTLEEDDFYFKLAHLQALIRAGEMLPLLIKRQSGLQVAVAGEEWQMKDEIYYLIHDPRPKLLKRLSGGNQSSRLLLEKISEVEELPLAAPIIKASAEIEVVE